MCCAVCEDECDWLWVIVKSIALCSEEGHTPMFTFQCVMFLYIEAEASVMSMKDERWHPWVTVSKVGVEPELQT